MSRLITFICLLAICVIGSQAIKCWVGFSDSKNPPVQYEEQCDKGVNYCGNIYDPTDKATIANCDITNFCTGPGTFNLTYYQITCCNKNDCNQLK